MNDAGRGAPSARSTVKEKANCRVRFFRLLETAKQQASIVCWRDNYKKGHMKFTHRFLTLIFAIVLFTGISAIGAEARRKALSVARSSCGSIYYNPYWSRNDRGYDHYDPYFNERRQK
jgi:hypothetical protein